MQCSNFRGSKFQNIHSCMLNNCSICTVAYCHSLFMFDFSHDPCWDLSISWETAGRLQSTAVGATQCCIVKLDLLPLQCDDHSTTKANTKIGYGKIQKGFHNASALKIHYPLTMSNNNLCEHFLLNVMFYWWSSECRVSGGAAVLKLAAIQSLSRGHVSRRDRRKNTCIIKPQLAAA